MMTQWIVMSATFAAISTGLFAVGMFIRDLINGGRPANTSRARLELAPQQPEGWIDGRMFRLVEESGTALDHTTATFLLAGLAIVGIGIPLAFFESLIFAAIGGIVLPALFIIYLLVIRFFRIRNMQKNLPIALQAVADSIRSGQTLDEACGLAARDIPGPLGVEFRYAVRQMELGHSPMSVMSRMAIRVPLHEFRIFATAVAIHRRAGGNLSVLTERMAHVSRDRQDVRSHLMAVTAGSQLSAFGMVVGGLVAVAALIWLQPGYLEQYLTNPKGPMILTVVVGLQLLGTFWVWRILKTSY